MIGAREHNRLEKAREAELARRKTRTLAEIDRDGSEATATVPRLLDGIRIAGLLGISHRQFQRLVQFGKFPKPLEIGHNTPRWPASDYNAYVAGLPRATEPARRSRRRA